MYAARDFLPVEIVWWKSAAAGVIAVVFVKWIMRKASQPVGGLSAKGLTVLITGANCGIGKATAAALAKRDARVILACRDVEKAKDAVFDVRRKTNKGWLIVKELDLASFASIRKFANDFLRSEQKLDVVINNAGVLGVPFSLTEDGFETTFAINHLGHFLLTNLLAERLKESKPSRVIMVSSRLYKSGKINFDDLNGRQNYSAWKAYSQSKLANILFARTLSERLYDSGVTTYSVSPGMVRTGLARHSIKGSWFKQVLYNTVGRLMLRTPEQGCETILYCALSPDIEKLSGKFFFNCKESSLIAHAKDETVAKRLWEVSERHVNL